jgi:hypothetical protein
MPFPGVNIGSVVGARWGTNQSGQTIIVVGDQAPPTFGGLPPLPGPGGIPNPAPGPAPIVGKGPPVPQPQPFT